MAQQCNLGATQMDKRWVYMFGNTILHTDFIPDKGILDLVCTEKNDRIRLLCNRGTLQSWPANADCTNRKKASVITDNVKCSANNMHGVLYKVEYKWQDGTTDFLYEVCYSSSAETVLYARHKTYGFNLPVSNYKRPTFAQSGVVSRQRADSFSSSSIYKKFNALLGPKQKYVTSEFDFAVQRGHLANSQDFVSFDQMDETFKYINVIPQFRGSNLGNWKTLENWVHMLPAKTKYANVVTGTIGILTLPHSKIRSRKVPIYLMANRKNPMPLWIYKVVEYNGECYAFVSLNNESKKILPPIITMCKKTTCPKGLVFSRKRESGASYCCDYNYFVSRVGKHAKLC